MKRLAIPVLLLGFLGCVDLLPDASIGHPAHFEITQLRRDVWAVIATDRGHAAANSGILDLGGGKSLVFDTSLTPEVGALLKEAADSLIGGSVFLVVNSNFESDHVRGNQVFAGESTIFGTTGIQRGLSDREPIRLQFEREQAPAILEDLREKVGSASGDLEKRDLAIQLGYFEAVVSSMDEVVPTTSTLVWDHKMNFTGKTRRVKIIPFGHAVTENDAVLYLEADSLLFASDLLVVDRHPSMQTSNLEGWRAALDSLDLLPLREVVPGHGPITDKTAIERTRRYLDMVEQAAAETSGDRSAEVEPVLAPPFDRLLRSDRFRDNLEAIRQSRRAHQVD